MGEENPQERGPLNGDYVCTFCGNSFFAYKDELRCPTCLKKTSVHPRYSAGPQRSPSHWPIWLNTGLLFVVSLWLSTALWVIFKTNSSNEAQSVGAVLLTTTLSLVALSAIAFGAISFKNREKPADWTPENALND